MYAFDWVTPSQSNKSINCLNKNILCGNKRNRKLTANGNRNIRKTDWVRRQKSVNNAPTNGNSDWLFGFFLCSMHVCVCVCYCNYLVLARTICTFGDYADNKRNHRFFYNCFCVLYWVFFCCSLSRFLVVVLDIIYSRISVGWWIWYECKPRPVEICEMCFYLVVVFGSFVPLEKYSAWSEETNDKSHRNRIVHSVHWYEFEYYEIVMSNRPCTIRDNAFRQLYTC